MISKNINHKRALTIKEAAEYACVSRGTIQNWISRDLLPFEKLPGSGTGPYCFRRIRKEDLDNFLNQSYQQNNDKLKKELKNKLILLPKNS